MSTTRLEWKAAKVTHRLWWEAAAGPIRLRVLPDYSWQATGHDDCDDVLAGPAESLLAAQLAAEAAALDLLVSAVGAFGVAAPLPWGARGDSEFVTIGHPQLGPKECKCLTKEGATRLACALLAAARGAKP